MLSMTRLRRGIGQLPSPRQSPEEAGRLEALRSTQEGFINTGYIRSPIKKARHPEQDSELLSSLGSHTGRSLFVPAVKLRGPVDLRVAAYQLSLTSSAAEEQANQAQH